ncbi:MAG: hypothetical protein U0414_37510 [Polyangiaceae bacterium]
MRGPVQPELDAAEAELVGALGLGAPVEHAATTEAITTSEGARMGAIYRDPRTFSAQSSVVIQGFGTRMKSHREALVRAAVCAGLLLGASLPALAKPDGRAKKALEASKPRAGKQVAPGSVKKAPPSDVALPPDAKGNFETLPIHGKTIDFDYDGMDVHSPSRAYQGRVFLPAKVLDQGKPAPLIVFFHGLNKALTPHRWMGGGNEGDVRRIIADMVDAGDIPPVIVAGPGSIEPAAVSGGESFPVFDLDKFVYLSRKAIAGIAEIDEARIIVTGHSGAGCAKTGGVACGAVAKEPPYAIISIDTCMNAALAEGLGAAPPTTHVIAAYQSGAWERDFDVFRAVFDDLVAKHPANPGILRLMDELPTNFHDYAPMLTYQKWLPALLGTPNHPL